jgi:hypothetical protein
MYASSCKVNSLILLSVLVQSLYYRARESRSPYRARSTSTTYLGLSKPGGNLHITGSPFKLRTTLTNAFTMSNCFISRLKWAVIAQAIRNERVTSVVAYVDKIVNSSCKSPRITIRERHFVKKPLTSTLYVNTHFKGNGKVSCSTGILNTTR